MFPLAELGSLSRTKEVGCVVAKAHDLLRSMEVPRIALSMHRGCDFVNAKILVTWLSVLASCMNRNENQDLHEAVQLCGLSLAALRDIISASLPS